MFSLENLSVKIRPEVPAPAFPVFSKPFIVGCYSVNTDRQYMNNMDNLSYYVEPAKTDFPLDLNDGYEIAIKKDPELNFRENLDHLLKFIYDNKNKLFVGSTLNADFVCYRGLLRMVMDTPYERRSDWCIHASNFNGSIYLCEYKTPEKRYETMNLTPEHQRMCSWGFKFEQYCMSSDPNVAPDTTKPVDECTEFGCVFETTIAEKRFIYAAEMDGVLSDKQVDKVNLTDANQLKFTELKTRLKDLNEPRHRTYLRHKTRSWWSQCFLAGIEDMRIGMRNERGLVQEIQHIKVRSIYEEGKPYWSASSCLDFLVRFLNGVKNVMKDVNDPYTVYEFYFKAKKDVITVRAFKDKNPHSFIPDDYRKFIEKHRSEFVDSPSDDSENETLQQQPSSALQ